MMLRNTFHIANRQTNDSEIKHAFLILQIHYVKTSSLVYHVHMGSCKIT